MMLDQHRPSKHLWRLGYLTGAPATARLLAHSSIFHSRTS